MNILKMLVCSTMFEFTQKSKIDFSKFCVLEFYWAQNLIFPKIDIFFTFFNFEMAIMRNWAHLWKFWKCDRLLQCFKLLKSQKITFENFASWNSIERKLEFLQKLPFLTHFSILKWWLWEIGHIYEHFENAIAFYNVWSYLKVKN